MSVTTSLCSSTADDIRIRGRSLPHELMGNVSFTQMIFFHLTGSDPTPAQTALLDASLVALMEHGLTPTAITARMTYTSAPEAMQGAVAAGLLSVGSLFVGTLEGCAALLVRIVAADEPERTARHIVTEARAARRHVPGFGHPVHTPVDPRTVTLLRLAEQHGVRGAHCDALELLERTIGEAAGRDLPANVTGAIAAVLTDAGLPPEILRGIALISRCAGLVGHIREEQLAPAMRQLWHAAEQAVPYVSPEEEP
ncbi:MAG: citryl-CoA lyase [Myxococcota bacterium]